MPKLLQFFLDWSEVWAPLIALMQFRQQPAINKPVVVYIWLSLIINLLIDCTWKFRSYIPYPYNSNNYLYNVHSIVRYISFTFFFLGLKQAFLNKIKLLVPIIFLAFIIGNFSLYEHFFNYYKFSSRLLAVEAICLLFYVLQYYLYKINENIALPIFTADFWIVTGLGIYVTINFFIFLLYNELTSLMPRFAIALWNIHNLSFVVFNIFLAKGLYVSRKD